MTRRAAFVYDDSLSHYVLREGHVMVPSRLRYTYELLEAYGAFALPNSKLVTPRPATEEELLWFHTREYVDAVGSLSRGETRYRPEAYNFSQDGDNPVFPGMFDASVLSTGGSLVAAELVARGEVDVAFNCAGGLHHAMPGYASGFCIFNDPVIAIKALVRRGLRVAYVDIDAHHGDGVEYAFRDSPAVLTISLHESGEYIFPGTGGVRDTGEGSGRGYAVNLPLFPKTDDEVYLWAFRQIVPPLVKAFKPDVLVTQLGVDTHYLDPITHLCLTSSGYVAAVRKFEALGLPWVALGGGGYDVGAVARCWALAYGVMVGQEWPDDVPASYRERYGIARLRDALDARVDSRAREQQARRFAQRSVEEIQRTVFPVHRL